jgi:hypothetical protein
MLVPPKLLEPLVANPFCLMRRTKAAALTPTAAATLLCSMGPMTATLQMTGKTSSQHHREQLPSVMPSLTSLSTPPHPYDEQIQCQRVCFGGGGCLSCKWFLYWHCQITACPLPGAPPPNLFSDELTWDAINNCVCKEMYKFEDEANRVLTNIC